MNKEEQYPFPNFDKLSPEDQKMIRDFDEDPSVMIVNGKQVRTAAEFVIALEEAGILGPVVAG
ncbi:MAG TPA: hypothetical protein VFQ43_13870 [Nitrososphaera sp.]|nr:hypothetical protein [Nitrososphaera sp.]